MKNNLRPAQKSEWWSWWPGSNQKMGKLIRAPLVDFFYLLRGAGLFLLSLIRKLTPRKRPALVKRILIVKIDGLGDFIRCLPLFNDIHRRRPDLEVDIALPRSYEPVLRAGCPSTRAVPLDLCGGLRVSWRNLRRLRLREYDLAFDLTSNANVQSALSTCWSRNRFCLGPRRRGKGLLYDSSIVLPRGPLVQSLSEIIRAGGLEVEPPLEAKLPGTTSRLGGRPCIAIHPGASDNYRRWPLANMAALIAALDRNAPTPGMDLRIIGGAADRDLVEKLAALSGCGTTQVFAGLEEFMRGLAGVDLLICNNSGPMHLAAAMGVPCFSLTGPSQMHPMDFSTGAAWHLDVFWAADCSECQPVYCKTMKCWEGLPVAEVWERLEGFIEKVLPTASDNDMD
jgi:ADP-heptose:LPS heptosyltransferase